METRDVACEDDRSAEDLVRGILKDAPHVHAIEAWLRPRLVCRIDGASALTDPATIRARRQ
jgi:hypothetical protein